MRALLKRHRYALLFAAAASAFVFTLTLTDPPLQPGHPTRRVGAQPAMSGAKPSHAYSPFAVRVSGHPAFEVVTFKRVGADLPDHTDSSYEEVAESLAMSLESRARGRLHTEVVYTPDLLDPTTHVFCDAEHLYVDFWSTEPGWGYSLWSGCGAEDRFAWTQFPVADEDPIEALTSHILDTLHIADQARCYRRAC